MMKTLSDPLPMRPAYRSREVVGAAVSPVVPDFMKSLGSAWRNFEVELTRALIDAIMTKGVGADAYQVVRFMEKGLGIDGEFEQVELVRRVHRNMEGVYEAAVVDWVMTNGIRLKIHESWRCRVQFSGGQVWTGTVKGVFPRLAIVIIEEDTSQQIIKAGFEEVKLVSPPT